jgi:hypothetical protein
MFQRQKENTKIMKETVFYAVRAEIFQEGPVSKLLGFSCCERLLLEADSGDRGPFENPEDGERPPL